jgi:hypothetical protein
MSISGLTANAENAYVKVLRSDDGGTTFTPWADPGEVMPAKFFADVSFDIYEFRFAASPAPQYIAEVFNLGGALSPVTIQFAS